MRIALSCFLRVLRCCLPALFETRDSVVCINESAQTSLDEHCTNITIVKILMSALLHLLLVFVMRSQLMQASREQGLRKSHGQSANCFFDSLESLISSSGSGSSTPRSQLRARLLKSALAGSLKSCPGQGGKGKNKSKLRHASSSPEIAKQVQFHHEQEQQQLGGGDSRSSSPAGSDGSSPRRLGQSSTACELSSGKGSCKGDASSLSGLLSSLFGARKQQQQPRAAKQVQEQGAQTGLSLPGARVTKEEMQSSVEETGQRALCVGRQKERAAAEDMSEELAQLSGRTKSGTQTPRPHDFFLLAPEAAAGISTAAAELNGELGGACGSWAIVTSASCRAVDT
jgi:hypothetical protein